MFELQAALAAKNLMKAVRIIRYFEANPKAAPIQLVLPSLYGFFSKVFMLFGIQTKDEKVLASAIGVNAYFIKDYLQAAKLYGFAGVENVLLLLHNYNLRSVGVYDIGTDDAALMKEMVAKMIG